MIFLSTGITTDDKEIFLININEIIEKEGVKKTPSKRKTDNATTEQSKKDNQESASSQESDSDSQSDSQITKRKRKRRRKSKEKETPPPHGDENEEVPDKRSRQSEECDDSNAESDTQESTDIKNESESRLYSIKQEEEEQEDDDDDLVFVKEEPKDLNSSCSYSQASGDMSQMYGEMGQLQELALQLSSDVPSSLASASVMVSNCFI